MIKIHFETKQIISIAKLLIKEAKKKPDGVIQISFNALNYDEIDHPAGDGIVWTDDIDI